MSIEIDRNRSAWLEGWRDDDDATPMPGDLRCDVAIIGGGMTGVSTAYHLATRYPNRRIILLEAKRLGNGASGRNGGMLLNYLSGLQNPSSPEEALTRYQLLKGTVDSIEELITSHALDVELVRSGHYDVFTNQAEADIYRKKHELLHAAGLPHEFVEAKDLPDRLAIVGARAAIFDPHGCSLNGARFLARMRPVLRDLGVDVFEETMVTRIREGKTIAIETPGGSATANAVFLATNAYTPQLGYFRRGLIALHSHVVATDALDEEQLRECGWNQRTTFADDMDRLFYASCSAQGRLVAGGGSNVSYGYKYGNRPVWTGDASKGVAAITRQLHRYFPGSAAHRLTHSWTGPLGVTATRAPTMGVRGKHRNVFFSVGYSGAGMTAAFFAGRVLRDIYSEDDQRWRGFPFYQRKLLWMPPEPASWLGYNIYTRLTGRTRRRKLKDL